MILSLMSSIDSVQLKSNLFQTFKEMLKGLRALCRSRNSQELLGICKSWENLFIWFPWCMGILFRAFLEWWKWLISKSIEGILFLCAPALCERKWVNVSSEGKVFAQRDVSWNLQGQLSYRDPWIIRPGRRDTAAIMGASVFMATLWDYKMVW